MKKLTTPNQIDDDVDDKERASSAKAFAAPALSKTSSCQAVAETFSKQLLKKRSHTMMRTTSTIHQAKSSISSNDMKTETIALKDRSPTIISPHPHCDENHPNTNCPSESSSCASSESRKHEVALSPNEIQVLKATNSPPVVQSSPPQSCPSKVPPPYEPS